MNSAGKNICFNHKWQTPCHICSYEVQFFFHASNKAKSIKLLSQTLVSFNLNKTADVEEKTTNKNVETDLVSESEL